MPHLYIFVGSVGDLEDQSKLAFAKNYSNPPTGFNNKKFQEPKRHSSEKIVRNPEEQQQQASTFGDEQDQMQSFYLPPTFFSPKFIMHLELAPSSSRLSILHLLNNNLINILKMKGIIPAKTAFPEDYFKIFKICIWKILIAKSHQWLHNNM